MHQPSDPMNSPSAHQSPATRAAQRLLASLSVKVASHDMSHYAPGERMEASQKRDLEQSRLLAGLFAKLKATKEADGSSLFDHTTIAYGSNIRTSLIVGVQGCGKVEGPQQGAAAHREGVVRTDEEAVAAAVAGQEDVDVVP